jgi:hypothetical protein
MDKRKEDRFNTKLMVKLHSGVIRAWGVLKDLSANGLLVKSNHKLNLETPVDIEVVMPDGEIATIRGVVKRVIGTPDAHRKFGIGVEITDKNLMYRNLVRYVAAKKEQVKVPQ